jgi:hypothetical protein
MLSTLDVILRVLLIIATFSLFGLVLITYFRLKSTKILLIAAGFGSFVVYALFGVPEILGQPVYVDENVHLFLHLIGLVLILLGMLKD